MTRAEDNPFPTKSGAGTLHFRMLAMDCARAAGVAGGPRIAAME